MIFEINGQIYKKMLINGFNNLCNNETKINSLNVFPVPDGDTGTNMRLTLEKGISYIDDNEENISLVLKSLSRGMLLGARGNSGVILSQLFKGFYLGALDKATLKTIDFALCLESSYKTAYKAVINPAEGTILTVAREAIEKSISTIDDKTSIDVFLNKIILQMEKTLNNTPNLLKVLKDAGVVDSGGAGLILIYKGMLDYLNDNIIAREEGNIIIKKSNTKSNKIDIDKLFNENTTLKFGYCLEYLLQLQNHKIDISKFDIDSYIKKLEGFGNSIVSFVDGTIVKTHIHTFKPGDVLNFAQGFGEFVSLKMDNMHIQNEETSEIRNIKSKDIATIAVASGEGIKEQFIDFGVDIVLSGGDTFNTSANEFINAIKSINAKHYIILPNNKNIILAAKQAKELLSDKDIYVIETKTEIEGYFALQMTELSDPDISIEEQVESLNFGFDGVDSISITRAIRDSKVNDIDIASGEYISILNGKIIESNYNRIECLYNSIKNIEDIEDKSVIYIICGKNIKEDEINKIMEYIESNYDNLEVGILDGNQDIYDYLIGIN